VNVAGLVAFTPLRHYVMGEDSFERAARPDEIARMRQLLREAMEAGAFGFSSTTTRNHIGYGGRPLACRNASPDELAGLCHALRDVGRGTIEIALDSAGGHMISDADTELLRLLTRESGRTVTWLALFARAGQPDFHDQTIAKLGDLLERAIPQVTPRPLVTQGDLKNPSMFASFLSWQDAFNRPVAEQMALYAQSDFRETFLAEVKSRRRMQMWTQTHACWRCRTPLAAWAGKTIRRSRTPRASAPSTRTST
jgi:N-acyl-D-aspartate/D-glutamate deacylase